MERRNVSFTRSTLQLAGYANRFTAHKVSDKHHWVHIPGWYSVRKRALALGEYAEVELVGVRALLDKRGRRSRAGPAPSPGP